MTARSKPVQKTTCRALNVPPDRVRTTLWSSKFSTLTTRSRTVLPPNSRRQRCCMAWNCRAVG